MFVAKKESIIALFLSLLGILSWFWITFFAIIPSCAGVVLGVITLVKGKSLSRSIKIIAIMAILIGVFGMIKPLGVLLMIMLELITGSNIS